MYKKIKVPKIILTPSVYDRIRQTVGSRAAETGGILGGDLNTGHITEFFFDADAERSAATYTVAAHRINPVIERWNRDGTHLAGAIHSHPRSHPVPSSADVEFALRLLRRKDNAAMPLFLIPIVQSSADGEFDLRMFAVTRDLDDAVLELPFEIDGSTADDFPVASPVYRRDFARVRTSYDLCRLHRSLVFAVGCGGADAFLVDLARCGVGRFILLDPDTVQGSNLVTSAHSRKDVGRAKVEAVQARIYGVNRFASVTAIHKPIEALSDEQFRDLVFVEPGGGVEGRLLCGMTDSFWAQWRVNLLALNFGVPALSGQVYRGGRATEVVFTHPATTPACARCILSQRFRAYLQEGFQNDAGSEGAQYLATVRLNASKLFAALAILHQGTKHEFWGPMLPRIGDRNFILGRIDPDLDTTLGLPHFKGLTGAFADDTVWRGQQPESRANGYAYDCPDCGGTGNLADAMGKFKDTALVVAHAQIQAAQRSP